MKCLTLTVAAALAAMPVACSSSNGGSPGATDSGMEAASTDAGEAAASEAGEAAATDAGDASSEAGIIVDTGLPDVALDGLGGG